MTTQLKIGLLTAGVLSLLFVLSGCDKKPATSTAPPAPPEVGILVVQPQPVELTTELTGRTAPRLIAEVRPQVGGIILKRLFTEGSDVQAGDILYQIDPATYQAAYASAQAALAKAESNLIPARLKQERFSELVKINAVSQQDYDDVSAACKQAAAEVEVARAALEAVRINLDYTQIKAPISGRIGRSSVTTGALVTASQAAPLATIQQLDSMYVDVTQSTGELLNMRQNLASGLMKSAGEAQTRVSLRLEDGSAYPLSGVLKFSEVTVDQSTGSVTLRAIFPNPDQLLLPGMFVRAILTEGMNEQALLVPQRGVTRNPAGQALVMLVGAEEKVEPRVIKVARAVGNNWLVSDGLQAGDRVILEGLQRARAGTTVKAVPFGGAAEPAAAPAK